MQILWKDLLNKELTSVMQKHASEVFSVYMTQDRLRLFMKQLNWAVQDTQYRVDPNAPFGPDAQALLRQIQKEQNLQVTGTCTSQFTTVLNALIPEDRFVPSFLLSDLEHDLDIPEGVLLQYLKDRSALHGFSPERKALKVFNLEKFRFYYQKLGMPAYRKLLEQACAYFPAIKTPELLALKDKVVPEEFFNQLYEQDCVKAVCAFQWGIGRTTPSEERLLARLNYHKGLNEKSTQKEIHEASKEILDEFVALMDESERQQVDLFYHELMHDTPRRKSFQRGDWIAINAYP